MYIPLGHSTNKGKRIIDFKYIPLARTENFNYKII